MLNQLATRVERLISLHIRGLLHGGMETSAACIPNGQDLTRQPPQSGFRAINRTNTSNSPATSVCAASTTSAASWFTGMYRRAMGQLSAGGSQPIPVTLDKVSAVHILRPTRRILQPHLGSSQIRHTRRRQIRLHSLHQQRHLRFESTLDFKQCERNHAPVITLGAAVRDIELQGELQLLASLVHGCTLSGGQRGGTRAHSVQPILRCQLQRLLASGRGDGQQFCVGLERLNQATLCQDSGRVRLHGFQQQRLTSHLLRVTADQRRPQGAQIQTRALKVRGKGDSRRSIGSSDQLRQTVDLEG